MTRAIQIIQADMRNFFAAGFSIHFYGADHVISALTEAGLDPRAIPATPGAILQAALVDRLRKALEE